MNVPELGGNFGRFSGGQIAATSGKPFLLGTCSCRDKTKIKQLGFCSFNRCSWTCSPGFVDLFLKRCETFHHFSRSPHFGRKNFVCGGFFGLRTGKRQIQGNCFNEKKRPPNSAHPFPAQKPWCKESNVSTRIFFSRNLQPVYGKWYFVPWLFFGKKKNMVHSGRLT